MAVAWPTSLQDCVNQANFAQTFGETVLRSDMAVGPSKVRRRNTLAVDLFTTSIDVTVAEYTTFENYYKTSLNGGVLTFLFDHPVTKVETEFRFAETPQVRSLGGKYFRITMTWEKVE